MPPKTKPAVPFVIFPYRASQRRLEMDGPRTLNRIQKSVQLSTARVMWVLAISCGTLAPRTHELSRACKRARILAHLDCEQGQGDGNVESPRYALTAAVARESE